jgi:hypothetical protein
MANPVSNRPKKKKTSSINWRQVLIVGVMIIAILGMVLPNILSLFNSGPSPMAPPSSNSSTNPPTANNNEMPEPKFQKEGELSFIGSASGQQLAKIDIEIADNDMERGFGLMYRRSMGENQGMLFLFDNNEPQSFWMKNTLIPLDILFISEDFTINTIHKFKIRGGSGGRIYGAARHQGRRQDPMVSTKNSQYKTA